MINNNDKSKLSTLMEKIRWIGNEGFDETFESVIVKDFKDFKPIQVDSSGRESTFNYGVSQKIFEDTIKNSDNFVDLIQKLILSPIECGIFSHKLRVNLFMDKDIFEVSLNNKSYIKGIDEEFQFESKLKIGEVEITSYPFRELLRDNTKDLVGLKKLLSQIDLLAETSKELNNIDETKVGFLSRIWLKRYKKNLKKYGYLYRSSQSGIGYFLNW